MSRGRDAATMLDRGLLIDARGNGVAIAIVESTATRWASATFTGARHRIIVTGAMTAGVAAWLDGLAEAEFALRGHLVADLTVRERRLGIDDFTAAIEVLTVEDR